MRRRTVLVGALSLLAGCGSLEAVGDDRADETVTPAPVPSSEPTATEARPLSAGEFCPQSDGTRCGHAQSPGSGLRFTTDRTVAELADGRLTKPLRATLSWSLDGGLAVFARSWDLLIHTGSDWAGVATPAGRDSVTRIDTGERLHWLVDAVPYDTGEDTVSVVAPLAPGRYALVVQTIAERSRRHADCIAQFDVVPWDG